LSKKCIFLFIVLWWQNSCFKFTVEWTRSCEVFTYVSYFLNEFVFVPLFGFNKGRTKTQNFSNFLLALILRFHLFSRFSLGSNNYHVRFLLFAKFNILFARYCTLGRNAWWVKFEYKVFEWYECKLFLSNIFIRITFWV